MATTIARTQDVDDSGPGIDGTVHNNEWKNEIYDQIDALFTGAFSLVGPLTVTGFGTHSFSSGGTGTNILSVRNTTAGTGNVTRLAVGNDADANLFMIQSYSSTYTTSGLAVANGSAFIQSETGGLSIAATAGEIRFYSGGSTRRMLLSTAGVLTLDAYTAATWAAGDKYLVVSATGVVHVSATGPAS